MNDTKDKIINLLLSLKLDGMREWIIDLEDCNFFTEPASKRYHGNYPGGLADHSYNVLKLFSGFNNIFKLKIPRRTIILCGIGHDRCKCSKPMVGHGKLSVELIKPFIRLTPLEEKVIIYHMGMYGTLLYYGGMHLQDVIDAFNDRIVKLFYFCDDLASQFKDVTK